MLPVSSVPETDRQEWVNVRVPSFVPQSVLTPGESCINHEAYPFNSLSPWETIRGFVLFCCLSVFKELSYSLFNSFNIDLFIWLHQVLVAVPGILGP